MIDNFVKVFCLAVLLVGLAGCSTSMRPPRLTAKQNVRLDSLFRALESTNTMTVYALDPSKLFNDETSGFHGVGIASSLVVNNASATKKISRMLRSHLGKDEESGDLCFAPIHGLRVESGTVTYDVVVATDCGHAHIYYSTGIDMDRLTLKSGSVDDYLGELLAAPPGR